MRLKNARLVELCTPETVLVQNGMLKTRYLFLNPLRIMQGVQGVDTRLMDCIVKDVLVLQKKLEEDLVTYFQGFQNTSESSDDSTNVVNIPLEQFVVKQDHESFNSPNDSPSISANSSHNPPHIDERCFECGDALDGIFCQRCACFDQTQPPQSPVIHSPPQETSIEILHDQKKVFKIKDAFGNEQYKPEDVQELFHKLLNVVQNIHEELAEYINTLGWNRPTFYNNGDDDDVDYTIAITPVLSTEEPDNSLSMGDEHLDTILATESDEVIKSSVEDLVPIPSEFKGIPVKPT
uniref:Uncharacterized protein n=1 Tax=Tanacetum cinerariifolium TaxID=118510 RepID=A0A699IFM5_TANCI|nr:hypothetical protein [Tanacetum cinerariifolium]